MSIKQIKLYDTLCSLLDICQYAVIHVLHILLFIRNPIDYDQQLTQEYHLLHNVVDLQEYFLNLLHNVASQKY